MDARTHAFLQPNAAPSILGLFGFSVATLMVGAYMAGWFGSSAAYLMPIAVFFGGLAQFLAGMWGFKARDGLATAMHSMWGSFWMGFGLLYLLSAIGTVTLPAGSSAELAWWFVVLTWISATGAFAAIAINLGFFLWLAPLTLATAFAAAGSFSGASGLLIAAGWIFVFSAVMAWYTASALMLEDAFHRSILPLGKNIGRRIVRAEESESVNIGAGAGEPGLAHGQQ